METWVALRNHVPDIPTATSVRSQNMVLKGKKRNKMKSRQNTTYVFKKYMHTTKDTRK